ncbi:D-alanyl-D-alanine carboxypeptidase/D-alanyl-D-alanine endopeptidase [Ramlibacter albus]|uniref:D-alanyl-D-alanine carboxypeptidase/D-alanyl-D-alanine-endopeptidase n=1 Tax=Ramlibacter albus TaxID=2079448 RepID=A0A923S0P4_9BURK|nr:D-alanyl-D-alanine carboxypeptidase/D-alanyl-D-alanine-endopeptidase [Ramlibacter albus]
MVALWRRMVWGAVFASATAGLGAQGLPPEIEAALARTKVPREAVTLFVAPVDDLGKARVAHRIDNPVNPASVAKLVTTYAALELLGPAYTWSTPVYAEGPIRDGVLQGNLYIRGLGDPKLVAERLWLLMRRVQGLGIKRVSGDIVLDRSAFETAPVDAAAFDGEPLRPYNAAPDALLVNYKSVVITFTPADGQARVHVEPPLAGVTWPANVPLAAGDCGDWRTGLRADYTDPLRPRFAGSYPAACGERVWPIAFADPAAFAVRAVAGMWQSLGGTVGGQVREGRVPAGLRPVFDVRSPPLAEAVRDINKYSNNVMAQQLFLTLSLQARGAGTFEGSRDVLRSWWRDRIGGDPPVVENGSGLSRTDRVTARQLAQLLALAWKSPLMPELVASLPVTGLDGTLRRSTAAGLAHLKSGSLRDVAGIAGYVHGASGRRYVLVAIANHSAPSAIRPLFDVLVDWAARDS